MSILKKIITFIILALLIITSLDTSTKNVCAIPNLSKNTPIKIAVFSDNSSAMYISLLKENLERIEKENEDKIKFTFFDAKDNQAKQNESIEKALSQDFDLFIISIISPNLKDVESTLRKIMEKDIPIILNPDPVQEIINFVKPYKRFVVVGADFEQSGTMEGSILVNEWRSNKQIIDKNHDDALQYIMLKGRIGSPLTSLRTKYSILALNDAGIKTEELSRISSEGTKEAAQMIMESTFLKYGDKIEAIIANNDTLAIGAINALQKYGYNIGNKSIPVVGVDAIPEARELIKKGSMLGTVIQDPSEMAEALYKVGMNLIYNRPPLSNTNYKFNETDFVVEMPYREYKEWINLKLLIHSFIWY